MSDNGTLKETLEAGIAAARSGNRATARRLLESVIAQDPNNELAWIWLASSVTTLSERRTCLQKVLQINPNNQRAREALAKLGGERAPRDADGEDIERLRQLQQRQTPETEERRTGVSLPAFLAGLNLTTLAIIGLVVVALGGAGLIGQSILLQPTPTPTPSATPRILTPTPSRTPRPTITPFIVDASERSGPTLPPTFTPTETSTPTATFTPTVTPFPLTEFEMLYTSRAPTDLNPSLYRMNGDGSGNTLLLEDVTDVSYNSTGDWLVFNRVVDYEPDEEVEEATSVSEIFIAPVQDPTLAEQVTTLRIRNAYSPSLSPNARVIVFVSDWDGDEDLWQIDLETGSVSQLTFNDVIDRDPQWSPDGNSIVFSSDREVPGELQIYRLTFVLENIGQGEENPHDITPLTTGAGSSYQPHFSPDGTRITYVNDRDVDGDIFVMDADGQRPFQLTFADGEAEDRSPDFTPDGRFIYFVSNREDETFQIYRVDLDGDVVERVSDTEQNIEQLTYRPDPAFLSPE